MTRLADGHSEQGKAGSYSVRSVHHLRKRRLAIVDINPVRFLP
jgi:hypothetical protein